LSKGKIIENSEVHLFHENDFLSLEMGLNYTQWHVVEELPDFFTSVSAHRCKKCDQTLIVIGEASFEETDQREMGPEYYYYIHQDLTCPKCGQDAEVGIQITYYAHCWDIDSDNIGVEDVWIEGLDWLAEKYWELERISAEKETLTRKLERQAEEALRLSERSNFYVLIVEGKDDVAVWEQFLSNREIPLDNVQIEKYGEGGLNEAIKAAKLFSGKKLKLIPHKLILDSDNDPKSVLKTLKENGIKKEHFHILERKEIDSYLLDEQAISDVLSIKKEDLEDFTKNLKLKGKARLEAIFQQFMGHPPDPQTKGLIVRAMKKIPDEIMSIIWEIESNLESLGEDD